MVASITDDPLDDFPRQSGGWRFHGEGGKMRLERERERIEGTQRSPRRSETVFLGLAMTASARTCECTACTATRRCSWGEIGELRVPADNVNLN